MFVSTRFFLFATASIIQEKLHASQVIQILEAFVDPA